LGEIFNLKKKKNPPWVYCKIIIIIIMIIITGWGIRKASETRTWRVFKKIETRPTLYIIFN
jgi:hypothetical protein